MKTTKLILVIALLTFSTLAFSQASKTDQKDLTPTLSLKISLHEAMQTQTLVNFMRIYLNPSFLEGSNYQRVYTVEVRTSKVIFFIYGNRTEWKDFFNWHH